MDVTTANGVRNEDLVKNLRVYFDILRKKDHPEEGLSHMMLAAYRAYCKEIAKKADSPSTSEADADSDYEDDIFDTTDEEDADPYVVQSLQGQCINVHFFHFTPAMTLELCSAINAAVGRQMEEWDAQKPHPQIRADGHAVLELGDDNPMMEAVEDDESVEDPEQEDVQEKKVNNCVIC